MRIAALLGCLFVLASCAHPTSSEATNQTTEPVSKTDRPIVATFETHDAKVSILGGGKDGDPLRVVVRNHEGTIIADGITVDELRRTDPLLGAILTTAVAQNGTFVWAGY